MAKPVGQREQWEVRTSATFTDQHDREYACEIDKDSMSPVSPILPRNFRQPIPTPAKYIKPSATKLGRVDIDYDGWKRDILLEEGARTVRLRDWAERMYGNAFSKMLADPPGELLAKLGAAPPPVELVMAMESGQSMWALGVKRRDGSYFPEPSWFTPKLKKQLLDSQRQQWRFDGSDLDSLPVASKGQFSDGEDDDTTAPGDVEYALEAEEVSVTVRPTAADYGRIPPPKRGRPAKQTA